MVEELMNDDEFGDSNAIFDRFQFSTPVRRHLEIKQFSDATDYEDRRPFGLSNTRKNK